MSFLRAAWPEWLPQSGASFIARMFSPDVLVALSLCSGLLFFVSLFGASWAVRRLPADYLLHDTEPRSARGRAHVWLVLRNTLGVILLVMGVIMLVLPGQGLLTILAAFTVMSFPGKRRLEHKLMVMPSVLKTINRLRFRSGHPPLVVPERDRQAGARARPRVGE
jgi:Flp pilus assembly protein TadB